MINNDYILNLDINLEEKLHEQEIYKNILERTTIDYLWMREKIAYIHTLVKQYDAKNNTLLSHFTKYKNQKDEAIYQKAELEKEVDSKAIKRKEHIKFLESQLKLIGEKKQREKEVKKTKEISHNKKQNDLVTVNQKIDDLTEKFNLLWQIQKNEEETQKILEKQKKEIDEVFGTKEEREKKEMTNEITSQDYQLHKFYNQDLDKKRKLKQKYEADLEAVRKIHIKDVKEARAVNKNKSFEVLDFMNSNIRNTLIATRNSAQRYKELFMKKENLINESVNGFSNIYNITESVKEFQRQSFKFPYYSVEDSGSICKMLMVVFHRIVHSIEITEAQLMSSIGNSLGISKNEKGKITKNYK